MGDMDGTSYVPDNLKISSEEAMEKALRFNAAALARFWKIESSRRKGQAARAHPPVAHYATEGTTEPLCEVKLSGAHVWRTPPKAPRATRDCVNCTRLAERMGLR